MRASRPPEPPAPIQEPTDYGAYVLHERLGVGGMAEVFRAMTKPAAGAPRAVVVKRMLEHIAAEPGALRMFEAEARLAGLVEHPNVVRMLDYGESEERPFLVMELVPGLDLARLSRWLRLQRRGLESPRVAFVACELLAGLHAVHEATNPSGDPLHIVHGDVSPSNVLLSTRGDVKLADFGIAESRLREAFPQAAAQRTRGKLGYLSPEQVRGDPTDRRADVFAASVLIAELLLRAPLFSRESELNTLLAVRDAKVEPLKAIAGDLPDGIVDVLLKGLARAPDDRWATAAEMRRALTPFLGGPPAQLREQLAEIVRDSVGEVGTEAESGEEEVTMEPPLDDYFVERDVGGETIGPMTLAQLVEAVTMGRVERADRVRRGDAQSQPVGEIAELSGYFPTTQRPPEPVTAGLDIGSGAFLDSLSKAIAARASGVWVCERGEVRKEIYLVDGAPEYVSSNLPQELLGEFLVSREVLTKEELDLALAVLPRFDGRLGDTLTALGLVEPVLLFRHIAAQVREKLLELFGWDDGEARFYDAVTPPDRYFPLGLDPWRVLSDGIDRRLAAGLEQEAFATHMMDGVHRTDEPAPDGMPRPVLEVLEATQQPYPLQELVEALEDPSDEDRYRAYRAIRLALALDLVRWVQPQA